ncbi:Phenol hydroxylase subunit DmpK [Azotobacter vinelandii CA]|uniref:Phenol hydroxylase subunit DmpK n=2 Tax=Azotobacter vinelandii TaxID=354 RepID=C1DMU7_AZOVD|nr:phenol hydroxylase subunit [Azotobacter vinelandii]ACO77127.1 Phenol hydroxylase subunit DmpK [Azotobacter vinelandii DJ]AGK13398.1 Phenol hydroxylase subunit DmpK [Azotobacter vinelandii CA]AGK17769.1 Phenol hydroxylase subunit DmpK [Azotobacter vinelandii CA6]SFY15516.1 phenol hydroxylase P0 protein [Azotobacter vinelandii]GLK60822.1 phenol 2-monooxygenase [Azotobacter vinelandii]
MSHSSFEQLPRYVRVRGRSDDPFVEFDFAIGHPELFIELVLPRSAFESFCRNNSVQFMDTAMAEAIDRDMRKWRYGTSHGDDEGS